MRAATTVLHREHDAIVMGLRILAEIDRHAIMQQPVDHADLQSLVDFFSEFADTCHHGKEEQLLFPMLLQTGDRQAQQAVERLLPEHAQGRHWLARMRHALKEPFRPEAFHDAARSYAALLLAHIEQENTVLFPMAERLLDEHQLGDLSRAFEVFEVKVMGPERHEALHALLHRLQLRYSI
jgi:hemerythrin-like domain-containing protein